MYVIYICYMLVFKVISKIFLILGWGVWCNSWNIKERGKYVNYIKNCKIKLIILKKKIYYYEYLIINWY